MKCKHGTSLLLTWSGKKQSYIIKHEAKYGNASAKQNSQLWIKQRQKYFQKVFWRNKKAVQPQLSVIHSSLTFLLLGNCILLTSSRNIYKCFSIIYFKYHLLMWREIKLNLVTSWDTWFIFTRWKLKNYWQTKLGNSKQVMHKDEYIFGFLLDTIIMWLRA